MVSIILREVGDPVVMMMMMMMHVSQKTKIPMSGQRNEHRP